jgi:hypothetical protein
MWRGIAVIDECNPHMHIRNKEFPWGPDGLFEVKHNKEH